MTTMQPINKPALFVYSFQEAMPAAGHKATAVEYLSALWRACEALGMTEPPAGFGLPTDFPQMPVSSDSFRLLAARRKPASGPVYWAFMFVEYDTIGFIAALAPNSVNEGLSGWKALYEEWHEAVDKEWQGSGETTLGSLEKAQRAMLGETLLFQALCDPSVEDELIHLGREVQRALPGRHPGSWWETPYVTAHGFAVWDAQGRQPEDRHQRTMCVLAPGDKEHELDEWVWTTSGLRLPPFARCLLHAAKLRYERDVYREMRSLREVRTEVEEALVPLTELHADVDRGQPLRAGSWRKSYAGAAMCRPGPQVHSWQARSFESYSRRC